MSAHRILQDQRLAKRERPLVCRVRTEVDVANSTTLADVGSNSPGTGQLGAPQGGDGLVLNVEQNKHYRFKAVIFLTVGATGGARLSLYGTSTADVLLADITFFDYEATGVYFQTRVTALDTTTGAVVAGQTTYKAIIEGYYKPATSGTFSVQFAQSVSNGTNSSVLVGSYIFAEEI
jgi:hypothetical protein